MQNEAEIRLIAFLAIFAIFAVWEWITPYRQMRFTRRQRWPSQLGLIALNGLLLRIVFPMAAVGIAEYINAREWGLMNLFSVPYVLASIGGFILLDFTIYWQHVVAHRLNWFWRLHRTHHADTDFDLTTGLRFHPLEILLSMLIKAIAIALFGIPVIAVLLFEIVLSGSAMFNHSNIQLPDHMERRLRKLIVTPGMHRIHHSTERFEHDSNYGFFLSVWDRWFNSYTAQSQQDDRTMPIGLKQFREKEERRLGRILTIPFK